MTTFKPVHCPRCESVVMEIATGLVRGRCPNRKCRVRVWAGSDGHAVRIVQVDAPLKRVAQSA